MAAVPIAESTSQARSAQPVPPYSEVPLTGAAQPTVLPAESTSPDVTHFLAAGTLVAGGLLILSGRRRAGAAIAAAGTAFALLEEQEAVKHWWKSVPGFLENTQHFLDRVEGYLQEARVQGQRLQSMLRR